MLRAQFLLFLFLRCLLNFCHGEPLQGCMDEFYAQPRCLDKPEGYNCDCGSGFAWNSRSCISAGIDSRLAFEKRGSVAYAILPRKAGLPLLHNFTISAWVRPNASGTIISYASPEGKTWLRLFYWGGQRQSGFEIRMLDVKWNVDLAAPVSYWTHIMWVHNSSGAYGSRWNVYVNGTTRSPSGGYVASNVPMQLPPRGELVLGQSPRNLTGHFDKVLAFLGDMAHVNIWSKPLRAERADEMFRDCTFMQCGDAVQWADFRFGTRGKMRLRWPSGVFGSDCISQEELRRTCDKDCSQRIGAQCKSEVQENILWPRTKANDMSRVPCPGVLPTIFDLGLANETSYMPNATRFCNVTNDQEGQWEHPNVTTCISDFLDFVMLMTEDLERKAESCQLDLLYLRDVEAAVANLTYHYSFSNPVDLGVVSNSLESIVSWRKKLRKGIRCWMPKTREEKTHVVMASLNQIIQSFNSTAVIMNRLLLAKNIPAWNLTRPPGVEAMRLTQRVASIFDEAVLELLLAMDRETTLTPEQAEQLIVKQHLLLKVRMARRNNFHGVALPEESDMELKSEVKRYEESATAAVQAKLFFWSNGSSAEYSADYTYVTVILAMYPSLGRIMPNMIGAILSQLTGNLKCVRACINSIVVQVRIYFDQQPIEKIEIPVKVKFYYIHSANISNIACVHMETAKNSYEWSSRACSTEKVTKEYVICSCRKPGFMAVTTDMYDLNWKRDVKRNPLVETPSYVGCSVSALLCFFSFVMLSYYRTSSNTASTHKNFSLAVIGGQLSFMFGIDKFEYTLLCQVFAIFLHYFFLASLSWLMNEAFNLYIVITYAAHSHGDHTDGSMWRYYLLGWIVPAILVMAFVLANKGDYYASDMCWIEWKHIWLFIGPAITIIAITILVLTFTAKEHHESSYTKNEKANRSIVIQTKALWTQVILLSIAWSFAFITVKMRGAMLKYLYMVFNCLQGLFFIVFYFLLNEEVQTIHNVNQKRRVLELDGFEEDDDDDVFVSDTSAQDEASNASPTNPVPLDEPRRSRSRTPKRTLSARRSRRRKPDGNLSDDDDSDCEMIVTSV